LPLFPKLLNHNEKRAILSIFFPDFIVPNLCKVFLVYLIEQFGFDLVGDVDSNEFGVVSELN